MQTSAIILAAGASSRMGRPKQMLDINGEMLLIKTIKTTLAAGIEKIIVVSGANAEADTTLLKNIPVDIAYNANWQKGMGSSIRSGLHALLSKHPDTGRALILVCDQPLLTPDILKAIITKSIESKKPIVASQYGDTPGVPALFDKPYFSKLKSLPDDAGAKKIILQNPTDVALVPFPGGEIDLDTMDDYKKFING